MLPHARKAIKHCQEHGISYQLLDYRITKKELAEHIGGAPWHLLKANKQMGLFQQHGKWGLTGQNYLHALETHQDYQKLVGNNRGQVRLCSTHAQDRKYCGQCFMDTK
jgi:hypothetical protein